MIRSCFKNLSSENRVALYEKVLLKITKEHEHRDSLRNLFSDWATNDETLIDILNYLINYGYPGNDSERHAMSEKKEWLRQGGKIRIAIPSYLLTIQRLKTLKLTLQNSVSNLDISLIGVNIHDDLTSEEYLEAISEIQDLHRLNDKAFDEATKEIISIRFEEIDNMWVTWNEKNPNSLPELIQLKDQGVKILDLLGLGFNMEMNMDEFVGLCFKMKSSKSTELFRPGWGDATTYFYWDSIKNPDMPYGYTKTVSTKESFSKPEAVGENRIFHIDLISDHSFALK